MFTISLFSQKQDNIWLIGKDFLDSQPTDSLWGASEINFNYEPTRIGYIPDRIYDFQETNTSLCDKEGKLLLYSNGMFICNGRDEILINGDTLN